MKTYAMTSYLKLLTARVIKLEQEMSRQSKVSVVMLGGGSDEKEPGHDDDEVSAAEDQKEPEESQAVEKK